MTSDEAVSSPPSKPIGTWISQPTQSWILVALIVLVYLPVRHAGFIWDDDTHLTANPCIVGPLGFADIWTSPAANYFPLVLTTFWLEHALWGFAALPYHLVNVAFHAATAVLLIDVLRRLRVRAPWWGAALWALHPMQVESVAWVSELTNMQSGFFFMLAVWLYVDRREVSARRLAAVGLCALAAMLSKPSTVMLPVVLLLCDWWLADAWSWRGMARIAPLFLVSAAVSAWTVWEQKYHSFAAGPEWSFDAVTRLAIAGRDVWFYLGKLIVPYPLAFVYPRWHVPQTLVGLWPTILVIAAAFFLWTKRRSPLRPGLFAAAYFLVLLFPVLGFFDVYYFRYSFVADHFQYLAAIGPVAGIVALVSALAARFIPDVRTSVIQFCALPILLILAGLSFARASVFRNSSTLWHATLAANPDCWIGETIIGNMDARAGRFDDAARRHRHAIDLDRFASEPHYNLGIALAGLGRYGEAITEYERALELKPHNPDVEHNLGVALGAMNRTAEAIEHYQRALAVRADFAPTEVQLALALTLSNRASEALPHYENAIRLQPHNYRAQYSYARTLEILRRYDDAIPHFRAAIKEAPKDAAAHGHLGLTLAQLRDVDNAAAELEQAAQLEPNNSEWRDALAKLNR
jgi:tetratricopeptide (TPR) repeat protein